MVNGHGHNGGAVSHSLLIAAGSSMLSVLKLFRQRCQIPKLKKNYIESQNEITIVGEYKYERQRVCEHRNIFLFIPKNDNSHIIHSLAGTSRISILR